MRDDGAVLQPHSTGEGGEPQGSRKGRPRYPPEGRGKQTYESVERRHNEAQNSETYVHRHVGWTPWLRQPNKTLFAVRCKLLDRQDHCTAF